MKLLSASLHLGPRHEKLPAVGAKLRYTSIYMLHTLFSPTVSKVLILAGVGICNLEKQHLLEPNTTQQNLVVGGFLLLQALQLVGLCHC